MLGRRRSTRVFSTGLSFWLFALPILSVSLALAWHSPGGASATTVDSLANCSKALPRAQDAGTNVSLVRAESDSTKDVVAWQEGRSRLFSGLVSPLRYRPENEVVTVCLFSGSFVTPVGPPAEDGTVPPPHNLLRLLVLQDGSTVLDAAGYAGRLQPETPQDWEAQAP